MLRDKEVERAEENNIKANESSKLDGSRGTIILNFQAQLVKQIELDSLEDVNFGMWLPSEGNGSFEDSGIIEIWNSIYETTSNCWSYVAADLLKTLKLADERIFRLNMPDEFWACAFETKDKEQIILSLSKEKGIRLHFSEKTTLAYRTEFLKNFDRYCTAWREFIALSNGKEDSDLEIGQRWALNVKVALEAEKHEPLTAVGQIMK